MQHAVIIMGAAGRMGRMLIENAATMQMRLAGVVEMPANLDKVAHHQCPAGSAAEAVFTQAGKACVVDFTSPDSSLQTARVAARMGLPMVIGTTGINKAQMGELESLALQTPLFWSPNMSIGVNVLRRMLPQIAKLLGDNYDMEVVEIHHKHKKDAPSGTALYLAESLAQGRGWNLEETACYHREGLTGERPHKEIGMQTLRGGDVVGVHDVYFLGQGERIQISHQAQSRECFAQGALRASQWLMEQTPGKLYSMQDMLA